jgi:hypothetical protein
MQYALIGSQLKYTLDTILAWMANPDPWLPQNYALKDQVTYNNKLWVANASTIETDVPGISSKWDEVDAGGGGGGGLNSLTANLPLVFTGTLTDPILSWDTTQADVVNNRAQMTFYANSTTPLTFSVDFRYKAEQ